ncbi:(2Fe-2S)-binding protein [Streptomyces sp. ISL-1]|uniref:(2Fe-2S)-binding protein n=1 Tax=Streptomyces sp. ISL-1 TaxID=2817657 RepID=UPI0027E597E8|nr:(2Fe-2S)-binding protein [Streptomyces sp. ISL-1]
MRRNPQDRPPNLPLDRAQDRPLDLVRARPGPSFTVTVDGRPVDALEGQSVAAVLWSAGTVAWRVTRDGRPRGAFCGIGVCFDCLITVNDRPNRRACLVAAASGDVIRTQRGEGHDDLAH